jgi:hypothetical protein
MSLSCLQQMVDEARRAEALHTLQAIHAFHSGEQPANNDCLSALYLLGKLQVRWNLLHAAKQTSSKLQEQVKLLDRDHPMVLRTSDLLKQIPTDRAVAEV